MQLPWHCFGVKRVKFLFRVIIFIIACEREYQMKKIICLFCLILSLVTLGCGTITKEEAKEAFEKKDYKTALKGFWELAKKGDAYSQMMMGIIYFNGHGTKKNENLAVSYYRKSAQNGYTEAQCRLGMYLLGPKGAIVSSSKEGEKWLLEAAEKGHEEAQNFLALSYSTGLGLKKNEPQAYYWWTVLSLHGKNPKLRKEAKKFLGDPMGYTSYATRLSSKDYIGLGKKAKAWKPK